MTHEWIDAYCLSLKNATKDYQPEWEATRYFIGGKMFAMIGEDKAKRSIITLKSDPVEAVVLREKYKDIYPGYYMNKRLWNSIDLNGDVPVTTMQEMIADSYELVLSKLSQKQQKNLR
ncbi:MmcQ/YjbR family DNA-binding protein [Fusibacter paucivorans]|uniref:MmcQ/YjbR family DNA-binding protein n=1 Tax=Fusibacter paucivorans TaxID=76009 RepID=A0ABS5PM30_9FIRM|nr:MmcQ/YjbR family DNA-binding protein [Fusibacter paucivorans]MBS7525937.1 MmcQ/YjbR family DNA-binding protein [Fusibacter paucivorans]